MATEYRQRAAQGVTESTRLSGPGTHRMRTQMREEEQLQVSKVESATTADKPKYLTQAA